MPVRALAKNVRISPRKVSVVASLVRGRSVADALTILEHTPRRAATPVRKVIQSAQANADHNHNYKPDTLNIVSIQVTTGRRLKRYQPAARGSARPFQRKSAHILVEVDGEKRAPKKPTVAKTASKPAKKESK